MSDINMQALTHSVVTRVLVEDEIRQASQKIRSLRTADTELAHLRDEWSRPENLRALVTAGILDRLVKRVKGLVPKDVLQAWTKARGALAKFVGIFKNPKALKALTKLIGEITPENIRDFLKSGEKNARKVFEPLRMILTTKSDLPTLTDLIKRTTVGAGISEWFTDKIQPRADVIDSYLNKYVPNLRRVAVAAVFTFIWLNVDELSWEMSGLTAGFTGNMSLADLLASLPESALGAISSALFGIGYTIMPYMLAGRLMWLVGRKYLTWDGEKFGVNWNLVDKTLFREAPRTPEYRALAL